MQLLYRYGSPLPRTFEHSSEAATTNLLIDHKLCNRQANALVFRRFRQSLGRIT